MKVDKKLKITLSILFIILITLASFVGVFVQYKNTTKNLLPDYILGMDLKGSRYVALEIDDSVDTVIYDKEGNVVEEEGKDTTTKDVPVNEQETLTKENYIKSKQIIEDRLTKMGVADYNIRFDENTGKIVVELIEDSHTDTFIYYMYIKGDFTIENESGEVLLSNTDLKETKVGYNTTEAGTTVYLNIAFNNEGTEKLKEISNTYVYKTDEEGEDITEKVSIKIDGIDLVSTYFEEEIANGTIQLSIGQPSTIAADVQNHLLEASNRSVLFNSGNMPIAYELTENKYVSSDITRDMLIIPAIVIGALILIALMVLIIKHKLNGTLVAISFIGYIATLLIVIRYTNVTISLEGIVGILISIILNYIFNIYILNTLSKREEDENTINIFDLVKVLQILIPACIISVILCFINWLPIFSIGMTLFWGLLMIVIYNITITRTLLINK